jgi:hypothetical protein
VIFFTKRQFELLNLGTVFGSVTAQAAMTGKVPVIPSLAGEHQGPTIAVDLGISSYGADMRPLLK